MAEIKSLHTMDLEHQIKYHLVKAINPSLTYKQMTNNTISRQEVIDNIDKAFEEAKNTDSQIKSLINNISVVINHLNY